MNEGSFIDSGYFKLQDVLDYLKDGTIINNVTDGFIEEILKILKDDKTELSPLEFDVLLDEYLFNYRINAAKRIKSDFVLDFWRTQIDFYNLRLLIDKNFNFIKNGFISITGWNEIKNNSLEDKINFLANYGYKNVADKAFLSEDGDGNTISWEIAEEHYILEFCEKAVVFSLSCEPIFGYFYRRYCEIKNLNRILYARAFRINSATLSQQISRSYIA